MRGCTVHSKVRLDCTKGSYVKAVKCTVKHLYESHCIFGTRNVKFFNSVGHRCAQHLREISAEEKRFLCNEYTCAARSTLIREYESRSMCFFNFVVTVGKAQQVYVLFVHFKCLFEVFPGNKFIINLF